MSTNHKPIVILGTGRSGTSIIAGILQHLGVSMGQNFLDADSTNPFGFFEDIDFLNFNRAIIGNQINPSALLSEIQKIISFKNTLAEKNNSRWGWKDPMTTNLIDLYFSAGADMDIIWAYRDFSEVQKSCARAYGWDAETAKRNLYGRHLIMENLYQQKKIKLKIDFADLIKRPREIISTIIISMNLNPTQEQVNRAVAHIQKTN